MQPMRFGISLNQPQNNGGGQQQAAPRPRPQQQLPAPAFIDEAISRARDESTLSPRGQRALIRNRQFDATQRVADRNRLTNSTNQMLGETRRQQVQAGQTFGANAQTPQTPQVQRLQQRENLLRTARAGGVAPDVFEKTQLGLRRAGIENRVLAQEPELRRFEADAKVRAAEGQGIGAARVTSESAERVARIKTRAEQLIASGNIDLAREELAQRTQQAKVDNALRTRMLDLQEKFGADERMLIFFSDLIAQSATQQDPAAFIRGRLDDLERVRGGDGGDDDSPLGEPPPLTTPQTSSATPPARSTSASFPDARDASGLGQALGVDRAFDAIGAIFDPQNNPQQQLRGRVPR